MVRRFILHHTATSLTPSPSVHWECVQFSNGMVVISLKSGYILRFHSLNEVKERFESSGTCDIEWLDEDETESNLHYASGGSYLIPDGALNVEDITLVSPIKEVQA